MKKTPKIHLLTGPKLTDRRAELSKVLARASAGNIDARQELERLVERDARMSQLVQKLKAAELARKSALSAAVLKPRTDQLSAKKKRNSAKATAKSKSQAKEGKRKPMSPWSRLMEKASGWVRITSGGLPTLGKRRG